MDNPLTNLAAIAPLPLRFLQSWAGDGCKGRNVSFYAPSSWWCWPISPQNLTYFMDVPLTNLPQTLRQLPHCPLIPTALGWWRLHREETSLFMPLPLDDVGQFRLKIYDTLPIFSTGIVCFATTMHTFLTAPQLKIPSKGVQTDFLAARIQMAVDSHGGSFE